MKLVLTQELIREIEMHGENSYPNEGVGFLLGKIEGNARRVLALIPARNERSGEAARRRYQLSPQAMLAAENQAVEQQMDLLGIFHSHPDHPNQPSETDREWAIPWLSYLITSVVDGRATESRSWRLKDDRSGFDQELVAIENENSPERVLEK